MDSIIQVMESVMGARDPYTVGHQQRVARLACTLAGEMGLSPERIQALHTAASLHDLGKIAVPTGILSKPGELSEFEFAMIKTHPQVGYDILKPLKFPEPIGQIILQHHERINGSGYPQGIKGKYILLEAMILGVADVLEAMCSHRPYRPGLGLDKALEEISESKGVLYDAAVVDACLHLCEQSQGVEQLFMVPHLDRHYQMIPRDIPTTKGNGEKRGRERQWLGRAGPFRFPEVRANQVRFLLHTAVASISGVIIMLGNRGF